jgi:hypothetical protein
MIKIRIVEDGQNVAKAPIFLTASKKSVLRDTAKELGAATFFQKPHEWEITPPKIRWVTSSHQI